MDKLMRLHPAKFFFTLVVMTCLISCDANFTKSPIQTTPLPTQTQEYAKMIKQWMADPTVEFVLSNGQSHLFDSPNGNEFYVSSYNIREDNFVKEDGSQHHGTVAWLSLTVLDRTTSAGLPPHKVYEKTVYIGQTMIIGGFTSDFSIEILDMQDRLHDEDDRGYVVIRTAKVAKKKMN